MTRCASAGHWSRSRRLRAVNPPLRNTPALQHRSRGFRRDIFSDGLPGLGPRGHPMRLAANWVGGK
jgi:hypothetical protein